MGKYTELQRAAAARQRRFEQRIEENCRVSGHGRPATRREFLARGLIAGTATVFLPSIATLLAREVHAQTGCQTASGVGMLGAGKIPFLAIDQAGGANIAGSNVMVGKAGGQLDFLDAAGYAKLGLPTAILPQTIGVDTTFGLAMHRNSALLRGLLSKTSAGTRANTNGFVVPARSENDTGNNPHNPIYGIARAGANGEFVATIGSQNTESGGNSAAPTSMVTADLRPTKVSSRTEAMGLVGGATNTFPNGRVAQAAATLSALKLGKIGETQATKDLVQCGFDKTTAPDEIAVFGQAKADVDFVGGTDRVRYRIPVTASGPFTIDVELRYQSIAFRCAQNLERYDAPEPKRFVSYYAETAAGSSVVIASTRVATR